MKEIRKRTRIAVLVAGLIAIGVMPALAQDKPADKDKPAGTQKAAPAPPKPETPQ